MLADQNVNVSVKKLVDLFGPVVIHLKVIHLSFDYRTTSF